MVNITHTLSAALDALECGLPCRASAIIAELYNSYDMYLAALKSIEDCRDEHEANSKYLEIQDAFWPREEQIEFQNGEFVI